MHSFRQAVLSPVQKLLQMMGDSEDQSPPFKRRRHIGSSCDEIRNGSQYVYPLCWMISAVNLVDNLIQIHKLDVHDDVINFVSSWCQKLSQSSPTSFECPLIEPKELRDALMKDSNKTIEGFYTYTLYIGYSDNQCIEAPSKSPDTDTSAYAGMNIELERMMGDIDTKTPLVQLDKIFELFMTKTENKFLTKADDFLDVYDRLSEDKVVVTKFLLEPDSTLVHAFKFRPLDDSLSKKYREGYTWFGKHKLCIKKHGGGVGDVMVQTLLTYKQKKKKSQVFPVFDLSHATFFSPAFSEWIRKIYRLCHDRSNIADNNFLIVSHNDKHVHVSELKAKLESLLDPDFGVFIPVGGKIALHGAADREGHGVSFIVCDGEIYILDSNMKEKLTMSEYWKQLVYTRGSFFIIFIQEEARK